MTCVLYQLHGCLCADEQVEDETVFDLFERSGITRKTSGVKVFRGLQPDSQAFRFIRFDHLPSVRPEALRQLLLQIQNNEGFTLTATLRQDRTSRGTIMAMEGPGERRQFEIVSDGRTNTLDLVYWWADGSRNVISFEDVDLSDSQWKNVTLHVHGETATMYVNCGLIDSFILDEPFYEHLSAPGGRMFVAKGSSRETHFRVRVARQSCGLCTFSTMLMMWVILMFSRPVLWDPQILSFILPQIPAHLNQAIIQSFNKTVLIIGVEEMQTFWAPLRTEMGTVRSDAYKSWTPKL